MQFPRWQRTAVLLSALFYSQKCQSSQRGPQGPGKIRVYLSQMKLHLEKIVSLNFKFCPWVKNADLGIELNIFVIYNVI